MQDRSATLAPHPDLRTDSRTTAPAPAAPPEIRRWILAASAPLPAICCLPPPWCSPTGTTLPYVLDPGPTLAARQLRPPDTASAGTNSGSCSGKAPPTSNRLRSSHQTPRSHPDTVPFPGTPPPNCYEPPQTSDRSSAPSADAALLPYNLPTSRTSQTVETPSMLQTAPACSPPKSWRRPAQLSPSARKRPAASRSPRAGR